LEKVEKTPRRRELFAWRRHFTPFVWWNVGDYFTAREKAILGGAQNGRIDLEGASNTHGQIVLFSLLGGGVTTRHERARDLTTD